MTITVERLRELLEYDKKTGNLLRNGSVAGSVDKTTGYRRLRVEGTRDYAHRLAWMHHNGRAPDGIVDHINHNKLDNRPENLRDVTVTDNNRNRVIMSNNTSGKSGVYKSGDKWRAVIGNGNGRDHLGMFDDIADAIKAREVAESRIGYDKTHGAEKDLLS